MSKRPIHKEIDESFAAIIREHHKITVPYSICKKYKMTEGDILTVTIKKFFREADEK